MPRQYWFVARALRRRCTTVTVVALALVTLSCTSVGASGSRAQTLARSPLIPSMLVGVSGTSAVYELGWVRCHEKYCLQLLRSSNAGVSFSAVAAPSFAPALQPSFGPFDQLKFVTPAIGYAVIQSRGTTELFTTRNGARSWRRMSTPSGSNIFAFAATMTNLYAITESCSLNDTICNDFHFIHEAPTAKSWTAVAVPFGFPAAEKDDAYGQPATLTAFGSNVWIYEQNSYGALIAFSSDAGANFSEYPSPKLVSVSGCALTSSSSSVLWAQCPTGSNVSFFYSGDAGENWATVLGPKSYSGTGGGAFDPVSSDLGYLASGLSRPSGMVYRESEDAYASTVVGRLVCGDVLSMVFTSATHGLALCTSRSGATVSLDETNNGGALWSTRSTNANF